jgi:hypothetical protein
MSFGGTVGPDRRTSQRCCARRATRQTTNKVAAQHSQRWDRLCLSLAISRCLGRSGKVEHLSTVQQGDSWRVKITWLNGKTNYAGEFSSENAAIEWINNHTWWLAMPDTENITSEENIGYSITSSARCRNDVGIVNPIALAVVRLMTRSNLIGCSTGMSPGLAPRKILST